MLKGNVRKGKKFLSSVESVVYDFFHAQEKTKKWLQQEALPKLENQNSKTFYAIYLEVK